MLKVAAISDTHTKHNKLVIPECDVLIHAGDATFRGTYQEIVDFAKWFEKQPAKYKIFVPGNHEKVFEECLPISISWFKEHCPTGILLIEDEIIIEGIKFYGSPITPYFHNWGWNRFPHEIVRHWEKIPDDTNILITHGPPKEILDQISFDRDYLGCPFLKEVVINLNISHHIFGHIHGGHGYKEVNRKKFYNVSICDEAYNPTNKITVMEI